MIGGNKSARFSVTFLTLRADPRHARARMSLCRLVAIYCVFSPVLGLARCFRSLPHVPCSRASDNDNHGFSGHLIGRARSGFLSAHKDVLCHGVPPGRKPEPARARTLSSRYTHTYMHCLCVPLITYTCVVGGNLIRALEGGWTGGLFVGWDWDYP